MIASKLSGLALACAIAASTPATAQAVDPLAMAEQAAKEAERAAAAANDAARAARAAADALRAARASIASTVTTQPVAALQQKPPETENLQVAGADAEIAGPARDSALRGVAQHALAKGISSSVANGPNDSDLKSALHPDVQFSMSEKEKTASVSMSFDVSGTFTGKTLSTELFTLTGSGKLDDNGERTLAGLKGFAKGTDVSLTYSHYWTGVTWAQATAEVDRTGVAAAREACLTAQRLARGNKPADDADEKKAREKDEKETCNPYKYETGVGKFVELYNKEGVGPLVNSLLPDDVKFWGVKVTGNQAAYKYLDRTAFKESKDDEFGFSATLFGGKLFAKGRTSLTGSFTYKKEFEEADPVTLCQAVVDTSFTQCITSADGKPARKDKSIFAIEGRRAFAKVGENYNLAIATELSADVKNDAWSIVVPVYFATDDTGSLRAGIRGAYVNEKDKKNGGRDDEFTLGIFVGAAFSQFPY